MSDSIQVSVIRQADRPYYTLKYVDPVSGKRYFKSSKVPCHPNTRRNQAKALGEWLRSREVEIPEELL